MLPSNVPVARSVLSQFRSHDLCCPVFRSHDLCCPFFRYTICAVLCSGRRRPACAAGGGAAVAWRRRRHSVRSKPGRPVFGPVRLPGESVRLSAAPVSRSPPVTAAGGSRRPAEPVPVQSAATATCGVEHILTAVCAERNLCRGVCGKEHIWTEVCAERSTSELRCVRKGTHLC